MPEYISPELPNRIKATTWYESAHNLVDFLALAPGCVMIYHPRPMAINCESLAVGSDGTHGSEIMDMYHRIERVRSDPGDLIAYLDELGEVRHWGELTGNATVRSQWGADGPVLEHPWDFIPYRYGNFCQFLQRPMVNSQSVRSNGSRVIIGRFRS